MCYGIGAHVESCERVMYEVQNVSAVAALFEGAIRFPMLLLTVYCILRQSQTQCGLYV